MNEEKPARVLIVDDDEDILSFVEPSLARAGYTVSVARNGLEALRTITRHPPDVIVLDIGMPVLDGRGLCRIVQAMGADAPLVIFLSALSDPEDRVAGLEIGAADYISKPFETAELVARVAAATRIKRRLGAQPAA